MPLSWPEDQLGRLLSELAMAAGFAPRAQLQGEDGMPAALSADMRLSCAAEYLGIQLDAVECRYAELDAVLRGLGPAIVHVPRGEHTGYLGVLAGSRGRLLLLHPDGSRTRVRRQVLRHELSRELEQDAESRTRGWLDPLGMQGKRRARAQAALLDSLIGERSVCGIWLLSIEPARSFWTQLRARGVVRRARLGLACALAQVVASSLAWTLLGSAALSGHIELGWLLAWGLAYASALPAQLGAAWLGGRAITDAATLLKRRLLSGALRLPVEQIRAQGSGRLLAIVSESEALERVGLSGAFSGALALVQLLGASVVLSFGVTGKLHVALLLVWSLVCYLLYRRTLSARGAWTKLRFTLANRFVENVLGHRTRTAQQPEARLHLAEDAELSAYASASNHMGRQQAWASACFGRGWSVLALAALIPALLVARSEPLALALSLGGILQAYYAFQALGASAQSLASASVAWQNVKLLYQAAKQLPQAAPPQLAALSAAPSEAAEVLSLRGVGFAYAQRSQPVLRDCSLTLKRGDRVLLEGASGSGKSTLAALLVGLQTPSSGLILLRGLDRGTLGAAAWRRLVVSAPQFHENHLLSATLAFNLLMGRTWPASESDLREAESLCGELGLGPLLLRMPSGLNQEVGETGWQLSHGERSRIFLARALLQRADLVILDESFGALDPETLRLCMRSVFARAPSLVVIAHP
ncbi:MAG: hypothetical protein JWN04_5751 [Myxococcaceae bacterium]|nr:hypothetical protein [Myxococcaceae bacterium]